MQFIKEKKIALPTRASLIMPFKVGDRVKNTSDNSSKPYVFIVKSVDGDTYTVQKENTNNDYITYREHELELA